MTKKNYTNYDDDDDGEEELKTKMSTGFVTYNKHIIYGEFIIFSVYSSHDNPTNTSYTKKLWLRKFFIFFSSWFSCMKNI